MRARTILLLCTAAIPSLVNGAGAMEPVYELFKVDVGCPREATTFKDGWRRWRLNGGCEGDAQGSLIFANIADSGVDAMLASARLRHVAGTRWGTKQYMNMKRLQELEIEAIAAAG